MYEFALNYLYSFLKDNFDLDNEKISHKLDHTFHVVDNAIYLCNDMGLSEEDKELAKLIALLHDIGRFEQAKQMNSFREDIKNFDHAALGVKLLFETGEIRSFIKENKYDEIIKKAIERHSKYILDETGLNQKEILHSKIIRDADKIDSFRAKTTEDIFAMSDITAQDIESSKISDKVFNDFMNEKTIFSKDRKTGIDIWISYIAFLFGLEFKSSLRIIEKEDYINKLFNRFDYTEESSKMETLRDKAMEYLNVKLNYICKIASIDEVIEKYNYEIEHSNDNKENWIIWKKEALDRTKSGKSVPYYGILNGKIICEATAALDRSVVQNADGLADADTAYLFAFRTIEEFRGKGYFSILFKFMLEDLIKRGYKNVTLGVEPEDIANKAIYSHYGFSQFIKSAKEVYPDGTEIEVEYYGKKLY
ncbi:MAG: HD domain-containing protein [Oscillospiraceae bacterium]|nr:HD domain-containing protein [Oscillospiraceae bacterium]